MSKPVVVVDFAYKGPRRRGRGTGRPGLRNLLRYLQYRDRVQNALAANPDYERWQDRGMGVHWRDILKSSDALQSKHVLAWTWVVSPAPDLMQLVPEGQRRDFVCDLTERVVEDYYAERGFDLPRYSYILHDRETNDDGLQQLHTHVVLPGTAPTVAERVPVYNNTERGHDALFREVATRHTVALLDAVAGPDWRRHREDAPEVRPPPTTSRPGSPPKGGNKCSTGCSPTGKPSPVDCFFRCCAPRRFVPILTAVLLGAGIERSDNARRPVWQRALMALTYGLVLLTVTAVFVWALGDFAVRPARGRTANAVITALAGGPVHIDATRLFGFGVLLLMLNTTAALTLRAGLKNGGWLRERVDRLRTPRVKRGALGSSHFCTPREYKRFRRPDPQGLTLLGAFWGADKRRLDLGSGRFCLGGEDIARGLLTLGGPGSGKTQGVILPAIADRMRAGHSLIVADPQGELTAHVLRYAAVTRHLVVVHDPTASTGPRYNLAGGIKTVSDARAIADVLVPSAQGDNKFWTDSAAALLAACLIRFPNLGAIYNAMNDLKALAAKLAEKKDDAALLANSFIASVNSDGKVASNIVATLATALTGWASQAVRDNTAASDFDAALVVEQPTVVVLTCPGRMRAVYASYLGATLRRLMLDLDTIGEQCGGPLPVPVGVILDEFPALGRLDSLVADVNLVRKRRISILIGAQTKGQFHLIYGQEGTQALLTGLATQIIYGGCDADTAAFYSQASGTATEADDDYHRSRPLLTADEVVTPQVGNCTIFARYVEAGFATQVVLNARLTRFYERSDWQRQLAATEHIEPLLLERGLTLTLTPPAKPSLAQAAAAVMNRIRTQRVSLAGEQIEPFCANNTNSERQVIMTLTKNKMVREVGRRTRLTNRDVQRMLETLLDVWREELIAGGRIELENMFVLETQTIDRGENPGTLTTGDKYGRTQ